MTDLLEKLTETWYKLPLPNGEELRLNKSAYNELQKLIKQAKQEEREACKKLYEMSDEHIADVIKAEKYRALIAAAEWFEYSDQYMRLFGTNAAKELRRMAGELK